MIAGSRGQQNPAHASTSWRWAFLLAIAALLTLAAFATLQYSRYADYTQRVSHAYDVLGQVDALFSRLADAESSHRGYLLTGDRAFLTRYHGVDTDCQRYLEALVTLVADNDAQSGNATRLRTLVDSKLQEMADVLAINDGGDASGAGRRVAEGLGKAVMDDIRTVGLEMRAAEQSLLSQRTAQAASARRATVTLGALSLFVAVALGFVGFSVERHFQRRSIAFERETTTRLDAERVALEASASLRDSERFNQSILDNSADCITLLDPNGVVTAINKPGLALMDLASEDEVVGRPWSAVWNTDSGLAERAMRDAAAQGEGRFQAMRPSPFRTARWWDVIVTPMRDERGELRRMVAIARDITGQKRADDERAQLLASERAARSEAERAARMKDDFVGTLSHELRTPLNAILGWVGVLKQDQSSATLTKAVDVIDRNSRRQSQMIDDLLDMSRIISGKLRLDVQRVDMASVIEEAIASAQPAADAKGVRLVQVLGSAAIIQGDPGRLQQVVWNLVSNAIKFTARGGRVQVTLRKVNSHVHVQVSDTGRGITPELLPYIFQRFRQGDASPTRQQGGLGLGLAIVKNLVEMHGGAIDAASDGDNQGSTFTVRLPLALASQPPETIIEHVEPVPLRFDKILRDVVVLVLDDEPDARDLLQRLLEDAGARVHLEASATAALATLERGFVPDIILSDIGMPEQDGYDFIRRVRQMPGALADVPAAALTALARIEDRKRALLSGYQTHLAKPVDPTELVAMVASLTRRTGRTRLS